MSNALADIDRQGAQIRAEHEAMDRRWRDLWQPAGILPLSPREMRAWLAGIEALRAKLAEWRRISAQVEAAADRQKALAAGLRGALAAAGATVRDDALLADLVHAARSRVKVQRDREMRRAALEKELLQVGHERHAAAAIADLQRTLEAWQADWNRHLARIRIEAGTSPTAALSVIDSLKDARSLIADAETLRNRIEGIDRDAAAFSARVKGLITTLAPELAQEQPDRAAEALNVRLTAARRTDAEHRGLLEQLKAAQQEQADAARRMAHGTAAIEALCTEACCAAAEGLAEAEKRARIRREMLAERRELETRLRSLGAGATVDAFVADASAFDGDGIGPELEALAQEMERLESERSTLDQTIGTETAELKRMDGGAEAAAQAAKAEDLLAGLEADVARYARLRIAAVLLARAVEQYREKHQGPLIARASELFAAMTLGAFERLRAEYDDKGSPVMVGVRHGDGSTVTVTGMSDGTADQLYLALRLASLEQYLTQSEPLPFVVDDILLRFDDQRALATLEVLADLSRKTQVIFFTHHRHLVELAESHLDSSRMAIHHLQ